MAHKKGVGSSDNGRDSNSKRLGVKLFGGQLALAGNIIVRQRGTKYHPGENVYMGKDHTLHAKVDGTILFNKRRLNRTFVSIAPINDEVITAAPKKVKKAAPKKETPIVTEAPVAKETPAAKAAPAAKVEKATKSDKVSVGGKKYNVDDLKIVEGIGPKIAELLNAGGITTWNALSEADPNAIKEILTAAGPRYQMHNPSTWPEQAKLAVDGDWAKLEKLQDDLDGGVVKNSEKSSEEE